MNAPAKPGSIDASELVAMIRDKKPTKDIRERFTGQTIVNDVDLTDLDYATSLVIHAATFEGNFIAMGVRFDRNVDLRNCIFKKDVWMMGTRVGGEIDLSGVVIDGSWHMQSATVGTNLACQSSNEEQPRPHIKKDVMLLGITVGGQVDFKGAKIDGKLNVESSKITGCFFAFTSNKCQRPTEIGGNVLFNGALVEGETVFLGAKVTGLFQAVRAKFDDGLFLGCGTGFYDESYRGTEPTHAGLIDLSHAQIGGTLHLAGTKIQRVPAGNLPPTGPPAPDVNLSFADVQGNCQLLDDTGGSAKLNLDHGKFGNLTFGGGDLPAITADGLSFRRLQLPSDDPLVFLDNTVEYHKSVYRFLEKYLSEQGRDDQADVVHREMKRRDRRQEAPSLLVWLDVGLFEGLAPLFWSNQREGRGRDLIALAKQDGKNKSVPRFQSFRVVFVLALVTVAVAYLAGWFALIPALVLLASSGRLVRWVWNLVLDITTGCGTASERLGIYLLAVFVVLTVLFLDPESVRHVSAPSTQDLRAAQKLQPTDSKAALEQIEPTVHPASRDWGLPEATFMSVRVTLPMIDLLAAKDWEPSDQPVVNGPAWLKYNTLAGWVSLISYIAVPLFVASITGFLKRRGGE